MIMFPEAANAKVTAASEEDVKEKSGLLNKQDVTKSFWLYYFGCEESNSYERLQSLVYCASMIPCLKKLYPKKEDLSEALKRHLAFFNTEGTLGGVIQGISIAIEEEAATEGTVPAPPSPPSRPVLWVPLQAWATVSFGLLLCPSSTASSFRTLPRAALLAASCP